MAVKRKSRQRGSYKARWAREAEEFKVELENNIRNFEAAVLSSCSFLETEYGIERRALERRNFEDFRDAEVIIAYHGPRVAVHVYYDVAGITVNAAFLELENGRIPERFSFLAGHPGYRPAITMDSYVNLVSAGTVPPILPEASPRKPRIGIYRAAEMRRELLRTNMAGVVAQVAERLKTWCAPILQGDTSMFSAVQQFHTEKERLKSLS